MHEETSAIKVADENFLLLEEKSIILKQIIGAVIRGVLFSFISNIYHVMPRRMIELTQLT